MRHIFLDTETTGLDANQAELVGLSFSAKPGTASYIPCGNDRNQTIELLQSFLVLFKIRLRVFSPCLR